MRERYTLTLLAALALAPMLFAQPVNDDCSTAITLCAQQPVGGDNTGATGWPGFCPGTSNVLWYTFTTNSQGGTVNVELSAINCPNVVGMDNELSVIVLSGDGSCTPGSFNAESICQQDSVGFTLTTDPLQPNTQYWVIVAGAANNGAVIPAQCGFDLTTSGPGADVVGVDFSAGPDITIAQGQSTQLSATGGSTYSWSPTSGLSGSNVPDPFAEPEETTIYTVTTQLNNCTYTDEQVVSVTQLIDPPNTITPNGDGINDKWEIFGINDYPQADVSIYDRWGQRVYHSVGYRAPFDGTNNGTKLPTATYYWVIELNELQGHSDPYVGFLAIVN